MWPCHQRKRDRSLFFIDLRKPLVIHGLDSCFALRLDTILRGACLLTSLFNCCRTKKSVYQQSHRDQTGPLSLRNITNKVFFRESRIVTDFSPMIARFQRWRVDDAELRIVVTYV